MMLIYHKRFMPIIRPLIWWGAENRPYALTALGMLIVKQQGGRDG